MAWNTDTLDEYVSLVDAAGGPGTPSCDALWKDFTVNLRTRVDQSLDPFGEAYVAQQVAVYEELAGHGYNAATDELSDFNLDDHIRAPNPYAHPDPVELATHLQRLSRAFRHARPKVGQSLIDLGCGWGLSSEVAAYLGLEVRAVDINPKFVALVNARAPIGARRITATVAAFEDYVTDEPGDFLLFYECFHHAVRPWETLRQVTRSLRPGGKVIFAGEPINDHWWSTWGMRLDPMSIYCIRKYGWFESGWTEDFLVRLIRRQGMMTEVYPPDDPRMGAVVIATKPPFTPISGADASRYGWAGKGCTPDGDFLNMTGVGSLKIDVPAGIDSLRLDVASHRPSPLRARFAHDGMTVFDGEIGEEDLILHIARPAAVTELTFDVEAWVPNEEIGNGDHRSIGAHLRRINLVHAAIA